MGEGICFRIERDCDTESRTAALSLVPTETQPSQGNT
jgi:hypothetical protein